MVHHLWVISMADYQWREEDKVGHDEVGLTGIVGIARMLSPVSRVDLLKDYACAQGTHLSLLWWLI